MKKHRKNFVVLVSIIFTLVFTTNTYAQSGSLGQGVARVTFKQLKNGDTVNFTLQQTQYGLQLSENTPEVTLLPIPFAPGLPERESGYYTYSSIRYNPPTDFNVGEQIYLPRDDCWSKKFSFADYCPASANGDTPSFIFHFYDADHDEVMANSNGGMIFYDSLSPMYTYAQQNGVNVNNNPTSSRYIYCPYASSQPFPDSRTSWGSRPSPVLNSINGPFHDIYFNDGGGTEWDSAAMYINFIGEYPFRKCVISYFEVPLFGNTTQHNTTMIVLYETTNIIEFYLKHKPAPTSTNSGNAVLGIQNEDGTYATTITNPKYTKDGGITTKSYNSTVWTADLEAWQIRPTGDLQTTLQFYKRNMHGPLKDSLQLIQPNPDSTITACPDSLEGATWYLAKMTVTRTDGLQFDVWDSILVYPIYTAGLNEAEKEVNITLNPNPTQSSTVLTAEGLTANALVTVINELGKTIETIELPKNQKQLVINTNSYAKGIYYIRITSEGLSKTEKLIVK